MRGLNFTIHREQQQQIHQRNIDQSKQRTSDINCASTALLICILFSGNCCVLWLKGVSIQSRSVAERKLRELCAFTRASLLLQHSRHMSQLKQNQPKTPHKSLFGGLQAQKRQLRFHKRPIHKFANTKQAAKLNGEAWERDRTCL